MNTVTVTQLQQELSTRINEAEAELTALRGVRINTSHKALTNRAISGDGATIGDYLSNGAKALYVAYKTGNRYEKSTIDAYSYEDEDGKELGSVGIFRTHRTITPTELKARLDSVIDQREESLRLLKLDLINAKKIVATHNKLTKQVNDLLDNVTWATRGVLR